MAALEAGSETAKTRPMRARDIEANVAAGMPTLPR